MVVYKTTWRKVTCLHLNCLCIPEYPKGKQGSSSAIVQDTHETAA